MEADCEFFGFAMQVNLKDDIRPFSLHLCFPVVDYLLRDLLSPRALQVNVVNKRLLSNWIKFFVTM